MSPILSWGFLGRPSGLLRKVLLLSLSLLTFYALLHPWPLAIRAANSDGGAADRRFARALALPSSVPVQYRAGTLELQWAERAAEYAQRAGGFCAVLAGEATEWQALLDAVAATRSAALGGSGGASAQHRSGAVEWSTISYSDGSSVALEPLAGILRDPRTTCQGSALTPSVPWGPQDSKATVYLDPGFYRALASTLAPPGSAAPRSAQPRALLLDLGSTLWSSAQPYSGLSWLVHAYAELGIEFSDVLAWEAHEKPANEYFLDMPPELAARTHFYNVPVVASTSAVGPGGVFRMLKALARPEDFVVVKLDIDMDTLEEELVLSILESTELGALIDDFYFEHHVNTLGVMTAWGEGHPRDTAGSIALFQALRRRGIRAHPWP